MKGGSSPRRRKDGGTAKIGLAMEDGGGGQWWSVCDGLEHGETKLDEATGCGGKGRGSTAFYRDRETGRRLASSGGVPSKH
jgi:hypothetical protein